MVGGLSPPARGNRIRFSDRIVRAGSIPARAGQPEAPSMEDTDSGVYPRPRGATTKPLNVGEILTGLSPPARGNLTTGVPSSYPPRSIPARAGQPRSPWPRRRRLPVYPRPRGATVNRASIKALALGLSPPARGNQHVAVGGELRPRSIPARAGQPIFSIASESCPSVYPRPRGATIVVRVGKARVVGLSPPARGNLGAARACARKDGSIPARAGQPRWCCPARSHTGVYPRPRGATTWG